MEDSELIERRRDPADRRAWRLFLTARSRLVIDQVKVLLVELEEEMLARLDAAQREALAETLEIVRTNFSTVRLLPEVVNG